MRFTTDAIIKNAKVEYPVYDSGELFCYARSQEEAEMITSKLNALVSESRTPSLSTAEANKAGQDLIDTFRMRQRTDGRVFTSFGAKAPAGVARVALRVLLEDN